MEPARSPSPAPDNAVATDDWRFAAPYGVHTPDLADGLPEIDWQLSPAPQALHAPAPVPSRTAPPGARVYEASTGAYVLDYTAIESDDWAPSAYTHTQLEAARQRDAPAETVAEMRARRCLAVVAVTRPVLMYGEAARFLRFCAGLRVRPVFAPALSPVLAVQRAALAQPMHVRADIRATAEQPLDVLAARAYEFIAARQLGDSPLVVLRAIAAVLRAAVLLLREDAPGAPLCVPLDDAGIPPYSAELAEYPGDVRDMAFDGRLVVVWRRASGAYCHCEDEALTDVVEATTRRARERQ